MRFKLSIMVLLILLSVSVFAASTNLESVKDNELILSIIEKADGGALLYLEPFFGLEATNIVPCEFQYEITEYNLIILFQRNPLKGFTANIIKQRLRYAIEF
ncbi:hypothetical protein KAR91_52295 [Candidatus Pacearchaeota archaeon]|nr:hypothetical protein [Candidatus Pacearchaeota archaeon]